MKNINLLIVSILLISINSYSQLYKQKRKKFYLNSKVYKEKIKLIEDAQSTSDIPFNVELVTTSPSNEYKLITKEDFVTKEKKYTWIKADTVKRAKLIKGKLRISKVPYSNVYRLNDLPEFKPNQQEKYIKSSNITKQSVLVEIENGNFIFLTEINKNIEKKYLPERKSLGKAIVNNIPYIGFVSHLSRTKITDDWKKGYHLIDEIVLKLNLIQERIKYLAKLERKKQREIEKINREIENQKKDSLANIEHQINVKKAEVSRAKEKEEIINKYGKRKGTLIIKGDVEIGFTKKMCVLSWGNPKDINRTTTQYLSHEQWVYRMNSYLYFEGDKLTAIQN